MVGVVWGYRCTDVKGVNEGGRGGYRCTDDKGVTDGWGCVGV